VVLIMWAATFSNGGVDEKDVIIMTQMRQINDLEKDVHFNFTFHFNITIQTTGIPNLYFNSLFMGLYFTIVVDNNIEPIITCYLKVSKLNR